MQSPLLLQKILNLLSVELLFELRFVCRVWNEECCKILQYKHSVVFSKINSMSLYIKHFADCKLSPHGSYHIEQIQFDGIYDNYLIRKFFKIHGSQIKKLTIGVFGSKFKLKLLSLSILEKCSDLEELNLHFREFYNLPIHAFEGNGKELSPMWKVQRLTISGNGDSNHIQQVLTRLLPAFRNIKCITTSTILHEEQRGSEAFFGSIGNVFLTPFVYLTELELWMLSEEQTEIIRLRQFRLVRLKAILNENVRSPSISALLKSLSSTLTEVDLESPCPNTCFLGIQNEMLTESNQKTSALAKLTLTRFQCQINSFLNFRRLAQIKLNHVELFSQEGNVADSSCPNLSSLVLKSCTGVDETIMKEIAKSFPIMQCLHISDLIYNDECDLLGIVIEKCPQLKSLTLSHDAITDEVITGLPKDECTRLLDELKWRTTRKTPKVESIRNRSYIGNLTNLQSLDLKSSNITDVSVVYGIIYCAQLQRLTLHSPRGLTNVTLEYITKCMPGNLEFLHLLCSDEITGCTVASLMSKMKRRNCVIKSM